MENNLDCYYSGLPSPKAYDVENKQPFEFNNDTNIGFTDSFAGKPLDIGGQTKTSIDWLIEQLNGYSYSIGLPHPMNIRIDIPQDIIDKSKSMYQKEMEEQWNDGYTHGELGEDI